MSLLRPVDRLALQTRLKSDVVNYLDRGVAPAGRQKEVDDYISKYGSCVHRTNRPCLKYNCHGLTFAARRTAIEDSSEIQKILTEDDYDQVPLSVVQPGDIAIYRSALDDGGEIFHSGIVVRYDRGSGLITVPWILSKWGYAHEVVHPVNVGPYIGTVEYYRVMP